MATPLQSARRWIPDTSADWTSPRLVAELVGIVLVAGVLWTLGGVRGALLAVVVVLAWRTLPIEYAFAAGQVALAAAVSSTVDVGLLAVGEVGLFVLLAGTVWQSAKSARLVVGWLLLTAAFGSCVWVLLAYRTPVWTVAVVLWVSLGVAAYMLFKHETVELERTERDTHR